MEQEREGDEDIEEGEEEDSKELDYSEEDESETDAITNFKLFMYFTIIFSVVGFWYCYLLFQLDIYSKTVIYGGVIFLGILVFFVIFHQMYIHSNKKKEDLQSKLPKEL